jgi:hypothetical protein
MVGGYLASNDNYIGLQLIFSNLQRRFVGAVILENKGADH